MFMKGEYLHSHVLGPSFSHSSEQIACSKKQPLCQAWSTHPEISAHTYKKKGDSNVAAGVNYNVCSIFELV